MKHWTILAALLAASAQAITDTILELEAYPADLKQPKQTPQEPEKPAGDAPRRGRPPGSTNAPKTPSAGNTEGVSSPQIGKTYPELQALIEPLVKEGRVAEVKAVIAKYAPEGLKTLATKPEHHKAFEADIEGLSL